ncbi:phage virion morphogenesis protein [Roseinatronobacter sp.]|uniref:phage virion morphogenesis protein n=1 Tax=Roseinatronobacter sp. TaxID=1945755 RepID=UPI0025F0DF2D|nr:phage virion morphogenesis protein [Roseibaca sp.]
MSGVQMELTLQGIESAARKLGQLAALDQEDIVDQVGELLVDQTKVRIDEEKQGPAGQAWDPWSSQYASTRHGGHSLLVSSDGLRDSIGNVSNGLTASVGVHSLYGAIHQFGGEAGRNGSAEIPARPYLGLSEADRQAVTDFVHERIEIALS